MTQKNSFKKAFSVSNHGLGQKRIRQLRNKAAEDEIIKGRVADIARRQAAGISTNFNRIHIGEKTSTEDYLEQSLKCDVVANRLLSVVDNATAHGYVTNTEDLRTLKEVAALMGLMKKYANFSRIQYDAARNGNFSSIIEVIDG